MYFCINIMKMAHVQIRDGVVDWYWTADLNRKPRVLAIIRLSFQFSHLIQRHHPTWN